MRIKILLMAVVLVGLLFSLSASAIETDPCCNGTPIRQLNYQAQFDICKFDQSLGDLQSVTITGQACGYATRVLTNEDPIPVGVNYTAVLTAAMRATIPGVPGQQIFPISTVDDFHLNPGESHTIQIGTQAVPECIEDEFILTTPAEMAPYIGNAGDMVTIQVITNSSIIVTGSTEWSSTGSTFMGINVCVVYEYLAPLCINGTKTDACTGEGLPGWEICLTPSVGETVCTTTDENGDYSFCGLVPGSYTVCETPKDGWKPVGQTCITVPLEDESAEGVNFENEPAFCISGFKFNGTTDEGLSGWTIQLKNAAGTVIGTDTTDGNGFYEFCGLFSGTYMVCEVTKPNWTPIGPTCITVNLDCADSEDNIFRNRLTPPPPVCGPGCPWFIKNELYTANCNAIKVVGADKGVLANEQFKNAVVVNPRTITIPNNYGTVVLHADGSFVFTPGPGLRNGVYVTFTYMANNGICDARYDGIAKIQVSCK